VYNILVVLIRRLIQMPVGYFWEVALKNYRRGVLAICLSFVAVFTSSSFLFADVSHDYPSHDEMVAEMFALKSSAPDYVQIGEIGKSVQGRPIYFFKISRPGEKAKSEALVAANIHGNEWIGNRVAMSMAKRILRDKASDPWISSLLDDVDFWFLPCINPDGYVRTWEELDNDDAEWAHMRKNANGVDLNRNFPLPAERTVDMDLAGSNDPAHIRYMGPYPYSEPETRAVRDFVASRSFFAAIDFHSNWAVFFPPKCNGNACGARFKDMLEAARDRQPHLKYPTVAAWRVDSFSGEMEDTLFYEYGVMAVCWEVFPETAAKEQQQTLDLKHPFWSMNPYDIEYWVKNDSDAALAAIERAHKITGGAPVPENARKVKLK